MADARVAADTGADALGLNFAEISPRRVSAAVAGRIASEMAGQLCRVGLFVDPEAEQVRRVLHEVDLDLLQFHGSESDAFCAQFGMPYMKAHRVREAIDADRLQSEYPSAGWHLLDAFVAGQAGGTGQRFDWQLWPGGQHRANSLKLVLAGGLKPDNVAAAIAELKPFAVDVSGGVEGERRGEKDPVKIRAFIDAVRQADAA